MHNVAEEESLDVHGLVSKLPDAPRAPADGHDPSPAIRLFPVGRDATRCKGEVPSVVQVVIEKRL